MGIFAKIVGHRYDTLKSIEWTVAIFTALGGIYLYSPLYQISVAENGYVAFAAILSHPAMGYVWGAVLLLGALAVMFGLWKCKPQIRSAGWFAILLARFFQVLTTWLTIGFLPVTWLPPLTLAVIVLILWARARTEVKDSG